MLAAIEKFGQQPYEPLAGIALLSVTDGTALIALPVIRVYSLRFQLPCAVVEAR
jgi:hypothetical protein